MRLHRLALVAAVTIAAVACTTNQSPTLVPSPTRNPSSSSTASTPPGTAPSATPRTSAAPESAAPQTASPTDGATVAPPTTTPPTSTPSTPQTPSPIGFTLALEPFAGGFDALTFVTNAGDGSGLLYIVEQRGTIWTATADGTVQELPFLDISDRTFGGGEQGLLGLAFHPDYESNGRLFVNYTTLPGDTIVSEFIRGDIATERVLLTIDQPFPNHNGGMIAFGSDGYLYIGMGDGGSGGDPRNNGQRMNTLLGKMLRIDVNSGDPYGIPSDNPFIGQEATRPEIWSSGLRNPWRFSFDRETGAMFMGDVGQGTEEEINAEPAGAGGRNYGWNLMEGYSCFAVTPCDAATLGLTLPVASYGQEGSACAAIGGYVYRGSAFPDLVGSYVFTDLCIGTLVVLDAETALRDGTATAVEVGDAGSAPRSFGEDEAGELYLVNGGGEVFRVVVQP